MSFLVDVTKGCTCYSHYFQKVKRTVGTFVRENKMNFGKSINSSHQMQCYKKEIKVLCYLERCGKQCRPSLHLLKQNCELFHAIFQTASKILFSMLLQNLSVSICSCILSSEVFHCPASVFLDVCLLYACLFSSFKKQSFNK